MRGNGRAWGGEGGEHQLCTKTWAQFVASLLARCETLGKPLDLTKPQFPHPYNGAKNSTQHITSL